MAFGSLLFVILGAPVGILFAKRDFLSAFITCFLPIISALLSAHALRRQPGQGRDAGPDQGALDRQRRAGRPGRSWVYPQDHQVLNSSMARRGRAGDGSARVVGGEIVRILDRQRYWAFLKAYFICYVSLVGLYIVIDAFSQPRRVHEARRGLVELLKVMGRYYLVHQAAYFDQLGGVISMMAAIFTVTWMQRNNEQLAMLAAGISTHRAIRPVLVSSVIVSVLSVANQEIDHPASTPRSSRSRTTTTACGKVHGSRAATTRGGS